MEHLPVLYLDLDDTLVVWSEGKPQAAPGAHDFVRWALTRFEVRWLTTWCPSGEMEEGLLGDLAKILKFQPDELRHIRGFSWDSEGSKLNGIAWLEHIAMGRTFVWLEDDYGFRDRERAVLTEAGLLDCYRHCNVTVDPHSLARAHASLAEWLYERGKAAA